MFGRSAAHNSAAQTRHRTRPVQRNMNDLLQVVRLYHAVQRRPNVRGESRDRKRAMLTVSRFGDEEKECHTGVFACSPRGYTCAFTPPPRGKVSGVVMIR